MKFYTQCHIREQPFLYFTTIQRLPQMSFLCLLGRMRDSRTIVFVYKRLFSHCHLVSFSYDWHHFDWNSHRTRTLLYPPLLLSVWSLAHTRSSIIVFGLLKSFCDFRFLRIMSSLLVHKMDKFRLDHSLLTAAWIVWWQDSWQKWIRDLLLSVL